MQIRLMQEHEKHEVASVCVEAFTGYPWYENLSHELVYKRWENLDKDSFTCLVAIDAEKIIGAHWFALLNDTVAEKFPSELYPLLTKIAMGKPLCYIDATVVLSQYQRRGVAQTLKAAATQHITQRWGECSFVTRMRSDNYPILTVNKKAGFVPSGIKMSTKIPGVHHEFWYC